MLDQAIEMSFPASDPIAIGHVTREGQSMSRRDPASAT
jgi:hypothetical protein